MREYGLARHGSIKTQAKPRRGPSAVALIKSLFSSRHPVGGGGGGSH